MIVNKITKSIEDRSDCDCNWLDDNWIYVKTGSALAKKIMKSAPFIKLIFDEMGNLVDISELERPAADEPTAVKAEKIAESKAALAEWLETHPYQHTDGKRYACTEEKQALLNGNLASFERAKAAGIEYPLKWNSTGDECVAWEYSDLLVLSLSIAGYVAPRVSRQQAIELEIKACVTLDELESIVISYE